ncbi:MAG: pitrilysin family protein [Chloroflexi bacterium]|nr:pitrilysin family protein [Chloroflexota bacterium]
MTSYTASIPNEGNINRVEFDNGIVLLIYENRAVQSVNITASLHAGSIYERPERSGLASLAASALLTGTQQRSFDEIHASLENIGAELSMRGHIHKLGLFGKALAEDLRPLLETANETLRYPTFPAEHFERLRGERLTWLQYSSFDTRYRAGKAMRQALYPASHPYHYGTYGDEQTIASINEADLSLFHAGHMGPDGMILVIVGDVDSEDAMQMVRETLGDWRNPEQSGVTRADFPEAPSGTERQTVLVPGKTQCDISMGALGPARGARDYLAAQIANSVLGEFGMMGRIGKSVREEQGLAYYAYSHLGGGHGPDPWIVSAGVNPDNVGKAIDSILAEIERLVSEAVSDEDLADNQSYFTGRLPLRLESNEGIASHIHAMESYNLGLNYLSEYRDMIYQITQDDVLGAAQHYLDPTNMVIAVAGPEPDGSAAESA